MKHHHEKGFSLIELLIVIVVIGILAAISISLYLQAKAAAEDKAAVAQLTLMRTAQISYYAHNKRFGNIEEIRQHQSIYLGDMQSVTVFRRGKYTYTLTSPNLQQQYLITAARDNDTPIPVFFTLDESGFIDNL